MTISNRKLLCPVCLKIELLRKDLRTCGSVGCVTQWRAWGPSEKSAALEQQHRVTYGIQVTEALNQLDDNGNEGDDFRLAGSFSDTDDLPDFLKK